MDNYEDCPAYADAMFMSLKAFGYELGMALADLIDNSITAEASNIWVEYDWNNGKPWIKVTDDGKGMTLSELRDAMRYGSKNPREKRDPDDLGRFGLGLKTASSSQCRFLTVATKTKTAEQSVRFWDEETINRTKEWKLGINPGSEIENLLIPETPMESYTVVLWTKLDDHGSDDAGNDDAEKIFEAKLLEVGNHLEMTFHRYLEPRGGVKKLNIFIGRRKCEPWDPFLLTNRYTQTLSEEIYHDDKVSITPYILPHVSHRTAEESNHGAGPKGWNAQQGFYIYRNKRMLVSGGYLDLNFQAEEHFKLARIKIDITNDLDHEWNIDVRKATTQPPVRLRRELERIVRVARRAASEIYRTRTGRKSSGGRTASNETVWKKKRSGEKIIYKINTSHPIVRRMLDEIRADNVWTSTFCSLLEKTVPHRLIVMDAREHEDCHVDFPDDFDQPSENSLGICRQYYQEMRQSDRYQNNTDEELKDVVCATEPYDTHPLYRASLDSMTGDVTDE